MRISRGFARSLSAVAVAAALGACSFAPDYVKPDAPEPAAFKESPGDWAEAHPVDAVRRGEWWKAFHDDQLNALEDQVTAANLSLKVALTQYEQARLQASAARTAYFPAITAETNDQRVKQSQRLANTPPRTMSNSLMLGADFSYEIDLWGRVRNTVAANEAQAEASAADLAGVDLALHAELTADYIALRADDEAQKILDETVRDYARALELTQRRFKGGVAAEYDVDEAETQLQNAKTQASDMRLQRAQLEHAIAVLVGRAPADFTLPPAPLTAQLPHLDAGLPSHLLERRPDIAAAERRTAAANAEIGVARAAYFPAFSLSGSAGFESAAAGNWFTAPATFWSLGSSALVTLFDAGRRDDLTDTARAAYDQTVAAYRQTVLSAYQEVEDQLAALHHLHDEAATQAAASKAADRALDQANHLYNGGATTYLNVVTSQNAALQAKLALVTLQARRLTATVQLIKALGGGWMAEDVKEEKAESPK